ncbi:MAG: amidohydrolase family protein [Candidatus Aenigmatarchaeota archaeon]
MIYDLVVSGRIVDINGVYESNIGIVGDRIKRISDGRIAGKKSLVLDDSCLIFPGFIDCHVHLREDASGKWNYKEDFVSGSRAAIHGGVTTVADMPNTPLPAISKEQVFERQKLAKKSMIDVLFYGGVTTENLSEIKKMAKLVCGYKIYFAETTGNLILDRSKLEPTVKAISKTKKPVVFHCHPEDLETILKICKKYNARTHIAHLSKKVEIEIIKKYKNKVQLTCETCPHYLFFTKNNRKDVKPEPGTEEDMSALLNALKDGSIDMLSTDHAPHTLEDKENGASGFPGLDTYGNIVSWLLNEMKPEQIAQLIMNAASFLDIDAGRIKENFIANLTILNMKKTKIRKEDLQTKCGWSPFEGYVFPGKAIYTIYNGKILMKNGDIVI